MKDRFWAFALIGLIGVVCGCGTSDTEQVASSNVNAPTGNRAPANDVDATASRELTSPESSPADGPPAEVPSDPRSDVPSDSQPTTPEPPADPAPPTNPEPPAIEPPPISNPSETDAGPKDMDRGDSARPDRDSDRPADTDAARPAEPEPVVPTGVFGTSIGDTIPEIEGKDVEGARFRLSDYEGKVLMIDFWGDW